MNGAGGPAFQCIVSCYNQKMALQLLDDALTSEEREALAELKSALKKLLGERLERFVLYGSRARGDYDPESDVDVAIIVRGMTRELKKRIIDLVADIEVKHITPLSTLVLSEEDFKQLKKSERRIALDIEREGIPL